MRLYNGEKIALDICKDSVRFQFNDTSIATKDTMIKQFEFPTEEEKERRIQEKIDNRLFEKEARSIRRILKF